MEALFPAGMPLLAGVTGWPLAHTRSPALHQAWCTRYGVKGLYLRLPLAPAHFERGVRILQKLGFQGLNVTIPHKETAFACVDVHTSAARRVGAVNTLYFDQDGTMTGDCTDGVGFIESLLAAGVSLPNDILVLGAGGASRAICAALLDQGCRVTISNRTSARSKALREALSGGEVVSWTAWPHHLSRYAVLVNTTSLGMEGHDSYDWTSALMNASPSLIVSDIVYIPLETSLLASARNLGLKTVDGLGMLIHQARPGFERWFGRSPEVDPSLRATLLETLS